MKKMVIASISFFALSSASAYSINFSYPGQDRSTEYYGACDNGQQLKVVQQANGQFSFEGPAGSGIVNGSLDKAAAAACGEK